MDESQKPLAIGKWASNVKLAWQLTGYNIEIR
jgi:transcription antitermination factor NusA-like protein